MKQIWTDKQIEILKANYATVKTKELMAMIGDKSNDQIRWKAKEYKLKKNVTRSKADMTWLEDFDNPETCYWWGFIMADGCINHRQLILAVHERDEEHLRKFCAKCGSNVSRSKRINEWHSEPYTMVRTAIEDKYTLAKLKKRLKIIAQKTYNPPDLTEFMAPNRLIYFLAGQIDGDGHIYVSKTKSQVYITIKVHGSWLNTLNLLSIAMKNNYGVECKVWTIKGGWACFRIGKMRQVSKICELTKNKVPLMDRKWSKLDYIFNHCLQSKDKRLMNIGINSCTNLGK